MLFMCTGKFETLKDGEVAVHYLISGLLRPQIWINIHIHIHIHIHEFLCENSILTIWIVSNEFSWYLMK